jgi:hypothetical protein
VSEGSTDSGYATGPPPPSAAADRRGSAVPNCVAAQPDSAEPTDCAKPTGSGAPGSEGPSSEAPNSEQPSSAEPSSEQPSSAESSSEAPGPKATGPKAPGLTASDPAAGVVPTRRAGSPRGACVEESVSRSAPREPSALAPVSSVLPSRSCLPRPGSRRPRHPCRHLLPAQTGLSVGKRAVQASAEVSARSRTAARAGSRCSRAAW